MEKKSKPEISDHFRWLTNVSVEPPIESFAREKQILCAACNRNNAPTRRACLYCGAELATDAKEESDVGEPILLLRELEQWENGWNVILQLTKNHVFDQQTIAKIANHVQRDQTKIQSIFDHNCALPLARVESHDAADSIKKFLCENNVETKIIADENLKIKTLPKRVRAFEITPHALNLRLIGAENESVCVAFADIRLVVTGTLCERQIENSNERNRQKKLEIKDSREISRDENVIDFYVDDNPINFRISTRNCDFSSLGAEKKMLTGENFKILLDKLRARAERAAFDNFYDEARAQLNLVWRLEENRESLGWQRAGFGKLKINNRLTVSNAVQFLRYSRMLRELQNKEFNQSNG